MKMNVLFLVLWAWIITEALVDVARVLGWWDVLALSFVSAGFLIHNIFDIFEERYGKQ